MSLTHTVDSDCVLPKTVTGTLKAVGKFGSDERFAVRPKPMPPIKTEVSTMSTTLIEVRLNDGLLKKLKDAAAVPFTPSTVTVG